MKTITTALLATACLFAVSGCLSSYEHSPAPHPYDRILSKAGVKYTIHGLRTDGSFGIVLYQLGKEGLLPLRGMPLTFVNAFTVKPVFDDLSPLTGMKLECLFLPSGCGVADLTPLSGMPLKMLSVEDSQVADLSPLQGMKLKGLDISGTEVEDLTPLRNTSIEDLSMARTRVKDLSPLKDVVNLSFLSLGPPSWAYAGPFPTKLDSSDRSLNLSPLKDVPLERLSFPVDMLTNGVETLRDHKTLKTINGMKPEEFWKAYDEGKFKMAQ